MKKIKTRKTNKRGRKTVRRAGSELRSSRWLGGDEPTPMSEADVQLAIAIRRVHKRFGSLAAFYEHLEAERTRKNRELCDEQWRRINAAA